LQTTIEYGGTATISWTAINATACSLDAGNITGVTGSFTTPPLTKTTTYSFTAVGPGGTVTATITIQVNAAPKPILKVTVDNDTIRKGQTVNLLIESTNAVSINIKGVSSGNISENTPPVTTEKTLDVLNGTFTSWLILETTQFTVTATGIDGSTEVASPPIIIVPTRRDTLLSRYWMVTDSSKVLFEGVWSPRYWTKDDLAKKYKFYENGTYGYIDGNGKPNGFWEWNLVGTDSIKMDAKVLKMVLTDSTMVLSINYLSLGKPVYAVTVYKGFKIK